jgi:hypothetical protein
MNRTDCAHPEKQHSETPQPTNSCPREHFEQRGGDILRSFFRNRSEPPHQSLPVYGAELVERHLPSFPLKSHRYPGGVGPRDCSHGSDDDSPQMLVHFIR